MDSCLPAESCQNDIMKEVEFHSAHLGDGGAAVALPRNIKTLIDAWVGKTSSLNNFLGEVEKIVPDAQLSVDWKYQCILLKIKENERIHCWRLMEFNLIEK